MLTANISHGFRLYHSPALHIPTPDVPNQHTRSHPSARWNRKSVLHINSRKKKEDFLRFRRLLQAYFGVAFGANLIQTIFAGLQLNPVMNIMALPFAVVVSVIAATTVFRNVFTAYDAFSGDLNAPSDESKSGVVRTNARIIFNRNTTTHPATTTMGTNEYPLGDFKNSRPGDTVGALSVHKVVDVEDGDSSRRHVGFSPVLGVMFLKCSSVPRSGKVTTASSFQRNRTIYSAVRFGGGNLGNLCV